MSPIKVTARFCIQEEGEADVPLAGNQNDLAPVVVSALAALRQANLGVTGFGYSLLRPQGSDATDCSVRVEAQGTPPGTETARSAEEIALTSMAEWYPCLPTNLPVSDIHVDVELIPSP